MIIMIPAFSDEINALLKRFDDIFDRHLRKFLEKRSNLYGMTQPPIDHLDRAAAYALGVDTPQRSGGKRIRPMLCLLTAHYLGVPMREALPFATAIEIMHNFTLVHDDIEDADKWRRGRLSVWSKYGFEHGINIGDFMQNLALRALLDREANYTPEIRLALCSLMSETIEMTIRGQALDMDARKNPISMIRYRDIVVKKTGYCLAAPLTAAAIIAKADDSVKNTLAQIGLTLGPLFQIRDDVIDLTADKGRDEIGSDIREGKRSFLVAVVYEKGSDHDIKWLTNILDKPRDENTKDEVDACRVLFEKYDAFNEAKRVCETFVQKTKSCLATLPTELIEPLSFFIDSLAQRKV